MSIMPLDLNTPQKLTRMCPEDEDLFALHTLLLQEVGVLKRGHKTLELLGA